MQQRGIPKTVRPAQKATEVSNIRKYHGNNRKHHEITEITGNNRKYRGEQRATSPSPPLSHPPDSLTSRRVAVPFASSLSLATLRDSQRSPIQHSPIQHDGHHRIPRGIYLSICPSVHLSICPNRTDTLTRRNPESLCPPQAGLSLSLSLCLPVCLSGRPVPSLTRMPDRKIPSGRVSTYKALSDALKSSPRAVGGACRMGSP